MIKIILYLTSILLLCGTMSTAQIVSVGSGSYTTNFPGTDEAGRNGFPSGSPQLSGVAATKPVPTNDWWSKLVKEDHADNLFNYPLAMKTIDQGLIINNIVPVSTPNGSTQPFGDGQPIIAGVAGMNASRATVADHSDWTVTMHWQQGAHELFVTSGIGMPFLYFTKHSDNPAQIVVNEGSVTIDDEVLLIANSSAGADYAVYAPTGSTWTRSGDTYTSDLDGKDYWSMAMLPENAAAVAERAEQYHQYAYVFPTNTTSTWEYDEATALLTTTFDVTKEVKEGSATDMILGLLPHQWGNIAASSTQPNGLTYTTIRGELKMLEGNSFIVENTFKGILPTLPYLNNYSDGFDPAQLSDKIGQIENDGLATWTDSYNEGQVMNRLIQTARVADEMGNTASRDKIVATVKARLEDWLKAENGEVAFIYYYNATWSSLIGYPAGHGQDNNLNDHHFHWGYFIHAAAFVEQFVPGWSAEWGGMIDLLIRDAASMDRADDTFPFLRNFSPYAGHSWANGFATFPFGNDQESTSESMQFASSLIHWGSITDNDAIRDLGIYIYTTEQTATEEYWFDINDRTFKDGYGYKLASRIWGNGYDNQTFWTSDIAAAYGIELYPIHGGSLYLGHHPAYMESLWSEISANTGILSNEENPNLWHDVYWQYLSFMDPKAAIDLYDSNEDRSLKFGVSDAQTYHWLHAMNVLGRVNTHITANHPIAASFTKDGEIIYVAHNYADTPIEVTFSDGFVLPVPARELVTSRDVPIRGELSSDFSYAYPGGVVTLTATITEGTATKVEFFDGNTFLGEVLSEPFDYRAENLSLGIHRFYARVFADDNFNNTNIVTVQVGEQKPFGEVFKIPGTIEAGHYDVFEGGVGQNISYFDNSQENFGNFRLDEYVDAVTHPQEGPTLGNINASEWLEYSIDVETAGYYDVSFRFASDNASGGGPFYFEIDGEAISSPIAMESTNGWNTWRDKILENVELREGSHVLRLVVVDGEFNLGRMNFTYDAPLDYVPPVAHAGNDVLVLLPENTAVLDGSLSADPEGESLTYAWEQIYGPTVVVFDDVAGSQPTVSNLVEGIYKCKLTVSDGTYTAADEMLIIVSTTGNVAPTISIVTPDDNTTYKEGEAVEIITTTSDLDGFVNLVEFYVDGERIGQDDVAPFTFTWDDAAVGTYTLSAIATDNTGGQNTSQTVSIEVVEVLSCTETSNQSQQGSFSTGYEARFETVGTNVTMTFTLLDTDKVGVVAFLWQESPFTEYEMTNVSGLTFAKTFSGQEIGTPLRFGCKFAFAGGLAVTKYINYVVGDDCDVVSSSDVAADPIQIYPNPTHDVLYIDGLQEAVGITIYSALGQVVQQSTIKDQINVHDLTTGIYLIRFGTGASSVVKRFVKQ